MVTRFGNSYPTVGGVAGRGHLLLLGAAGLTLSLLILFIFVRSQQVQATRDGEIPTIVQDDFVGTVTLFASERFIRSGTALSQIEFKEVYWPRDSVPDGAVRDPSELRGQFARADIPERTPVQRRHLTSERRTLTLPITPGMRAVTIEVDAEAGLEGWALPGTRVDVVLTYTTGGDLTSKVIVQNARVLSYAGSADATEDNSELTGIDRRRGPAPSRRMKVGSTVTLEASPSDALTIQTSKKLGSLSLLMRAPEDEGPTRVLEVSRPDIEGGRQERRTTGRRRSDCQRGVMRMDGREYMIDCDGAIIPMGREEP